MRRAAHAHALALALTLAALAVACGGGGRKAAPPPRPAPDIWSFAPPGTRLAVALRYEESYQLMTSAEQALTGAPGAGGALAFLRAWLDYPRVDMRSPAGRARIGYDVHAPIVYFVTDRGLVVLSKLSDRATYARLFKVVPDRQSGGRLTVDVDGSLCTAASAAPYHICGPRELLLAILDGKGIRIPWPAAGGRAPTARVWLAPAMLGPIAGFTEGGDGLRVEVEVARGRLVARAHLPGAPVGDFARLVAGARSPLAAALPERGLSGAAVVNLIEQVDAVRAELIERGQGLSIGSLTWADIIEALRGDASIWIAPDDQTSVISIGLRRTDAIRRFVARCEDLRLPGISAAREGERCRLRSETMAKAGFEDLFIRVTDNALVAETRGAAPAAPAAAAAAAAPSAPPRAAVAHMREGRDIVAAFGSGLFAPTLATGTFGPFDEGEQLVMWLFLHVTESFAWVRADRDGLRAEVQLATAWSYDRETLAAIEPILRRAVTGEPGAVTELARLAATRPDGALARDLARGKVGSAIPVVTGVLIQRLISAVLGR